MAEKKVIQQPAPLKTEIDKLRTWRKVMTGTSRNRSEARGNSYRADLGTGNL
jgi:hypothetical protein